MRTSGGGGLVSAKKVTRTPEEEPRPGGLLEPRELRAAGSRPGSGEEPTSVASFLWGQFEGGLGSAEEKRTGEAGKGRGL